MNAAKKCPTCGSMYMGRRCPSCPDESAPESTPDLIPGQSFRGLEIVEPIGHGGMGVVYKARQSSLDRAVALKILPPGAGARLLATRFEREAKVLAALAHPNIVTIFDFGKEGSLCYFVMECVDGVSLREPIQKRTLSISETVRIVAQICDALDFAHGQGIVHRDIKPENVLLDRRGQVKVVDFGLAKLTGDEVPVLTQSGAAVGTYRYMAPEQMENAGHVDHRADLYSTAVVLYEMLTGRLPLGKFAPPSECGVGDARFDPIVMKALEKEPEKRYPSAREFKAALIGLTTVSVAAGAPRRKAGKGIWIGLAAVPLVLAAAAVWKFYPHKTPPTPAPAPRTDEPIRKTDSPEVGEFKAGRVLSGHSDVVEAVGFLEGSGGVSGGRDGTIRRWDLGTGEEIGKQARISWNGAVLALSVHPGGRWVASEGQDKRVIVWDMITGRDLVTLSGLTAEVRSVAFGPDGTLLAAGGKDGSLRLWEWKSMKPLGAHSGRPVTRIAFASRGDLLVCGASDGTVQVWEVRTQARLRSWKAQEGPVTALAVRPDTQEAATASADGAVRIWDVRSGEGIRRWSAHAEEVRDLAFDPAGRILATASLDSTVKLWDVEKGAELQTLRGHTQGARSVAFSRDGRRILSGGGDKTLRLWESPE